jgi:hypothetical protein
MTPRKRLYGTLSPSASGGCAMLRLGVREAPSERDGIVMLGVTPNATPGKPWLGAAVVLSELS